MGSSLLSFWFLVVLFILTWVLVFMGILLYTLLASNQGYLSVARRPVIDRFAEDSEK